jgi:hypothetical protein
MEKKSRSKEIRRCCTGMTISEVKKEVKAFEKGKKTPKRCYLCKRSEGDKSVVLTPDQKEPYVLAEIALVPVERKATKDWVFDYFLCWECAMLVGLRSQGPLLKERSGRTKGHEPTGPLPASPAPEFYS